MYSKEMTQGCGGVPGVSADWVTVLPIRSANSRAVAKTVGSVWSAGMSSTNFMTGTGLTVASTLRGQFGSRAADKSDRGRN